ncbi:hypothetical protein BJ138DRAFT_1154893 [Hygrophoropsis aurantiaca]|uniref:Uncharacterized protein n=1 Tax=Hygrophoropsis aurantiaca TaxID=72124 RepID=A0ACB8A998_9AGAM|nr:hypothetical protein BJ138DRAFT_1154893 [Hygrophoropsis aurantiaca]
MFKTLIHTAGLVGLLSLQVLALDCGSKEYQSLCGNICLLSLHLYNEDSRVWVTGSVSIGSVTGSVSGTGSATTSGK